MAIDRAKRNAWMREYRNKKRAKGECLDCAQPAESGKMRCTKHLNVSKPQRNTRMKAFRESHKAQGLCQECSDPAAPGLTRCRRHLDKLNAANNARRARAKAAGICVRCYRQRAIRGYQMCGGCVLKERNRRWLQYWRGKD